MTKPWKRGFCSAIGLQLFNFAKERLHLNEMVALSNFIRMFLIPLLPTGATALALKTVPKQGGGIKEYRDGRAILSSIQKSLQTLISGEDCYSKTWRGFIKSIKVGQDELPSGTTIDEYLQTYRLKLLRDQLANHLKLSWDAKTKDWLDPENKLSVIDPTDYPSRWICFVAFIYGPQSNYETVALSCLVVSDAAQSDKNGRPLKQRGSIDSKPKVESDDLLVQAINQGTMKSTELQQQSVFLQSQAVKVKEYQAQFDRYKYELEQVRMKIGIINDRYRGLQFMKADHADDPTMCAMIDGQLKEMALDLIRLNGIAEASRPPPELPILRHLDILQISREDSSFASDLECEVVPRSVGDVVEEEDEEQQPVGPNKKQTATRPKVKELKGEKPPEGAQMRMNKDGKKEVQLEDGSWRGLNSDGSIRKIRSDSRKTKARQSQSESTQVGKKPRFEEEENDDVTYEV